MTIYLTNKYLVPKSEIDMDDVKRNLDKYVYKENMCRKCPMRKIRFSSHCIDCQGFITHVKLWSLHKIKGVTYVGLPNGNPTWLEEAFNLDLSNVVDRRATVPFKNPIKFTSTLYDGSIVNDVKTVNQQRLVRIITKKEANGVVESPTRSGKTVFSMAAMIQLGKRTLVLAHKIDLLQQFMKCIKEHTNVVALEKKTGKKIAGIARKSKDFETIEDIVFATYQTFITELGRKRIKELIKGKFGSLVVDEVHLANAKCFSEVVTNIDTYHKLGLSATIERKDKLEWIVDRAIGPVIARGEKVGIKPEVHIIETGLAPEVEPTLYTYQMNWLSDNKKRNALIIRLVFKILRDNPKRTVVIPCVRRNHIKTLVQMINDQAALNNEKRDESWDGELAVALFGQTLNREKVISTFRKATKTRVAVVMQSIVNFGTDVPAWTDIIHTFLLANPPTTYQLCSRVTTPYAGKPTPRIHTFVDKMGITVGCFKSTFSTYLKHKYRMDEETHSIGMSYLNSKKARSSWD